MPSTVLCRGVAGERRCWFLLAPSNPKCFAQVRSCPRLMFVALLPLDAGLHPPHPLLLPAVSALPCVEQDGFVWVWPGWEEPTLPLPTFTRPPEGYRIHAGER